MEENNNLNYDVDNQVLQSNGMQDTNQNESIDQVLADHPEASVDQADNVDPETEKLINSDMIVDPNIKSIENYNEIIEDNEPKVDYNSIKNTKNIIFMVIIFAIIVLFILFLPLIVKLVGF